MPHVHVYKEVVLDRVKSNSRRADAIVYAPGKCVVYIEMKTTEADGRRCHAVQLKDTHSNLLATLAHHNSLHKSKGQEITVATLLVTIRFFHGMSYTKSRVESKNRVKILEPERGCYHTLFMRLGQLMSK